ncbi:MAG: discoidin domain-containing protein [Armatimonadetes bacterium]|nr:discoidin domain-containing protein [Armatimonadota bacterium]
MMRNTRDYVAICCILTAVMLIPSAQAAPAVAGATNLVLAENGGQIVNFSSRALDENHQPIAKWDVTNLIDGLHATANYTPATSYGWRSAGVPSPSSPEWIVFAFANRQTRLISRVVIDPTTDDPDFLGRWAKDIKIQVSTTTEEGPWKTVGSYLLMRKPFPQTFDFVPAEARFVKIVITGNWGSDFCVELGEVEVYEAIVGDDVLDQLISRLESLLMDLKRYRDSKRYHQVQSTTEAVTTPTAPATGGDNQ